MTSEMPKRGVVGRSPHQSSVTKEYAKKGRKRGNRQMPRDDPADKAMSKSRKANLASVYTKEIPFLWRMSLGLYYYVGPVNGTANELWHLFTRGTAALPSWCIANNSLFLLAPTAVTLDGWCHHEFVSTFTVDLWWQMREQHMVEVQQDNLTWSNLNLHHYATLDQ
jgi:hypothetical protein